MADFGVAASRHVIELDERPWSGNHKAIVLHVLHLKLNAADSLGGRLGIGAACKEQIDVL